jgi:hypothetical protein
MYIKTKNIYSFNFFYEFNSNKVWILKEFYSLIVLEVDTIMPIYTCILVSGIHPL